MSGGGRIRCLLACGRPAGVGQRPGWPLVTVPGRVPVASGLIQFRGLSRRPVGDLVKRSCWASLDGFQFRRRGAAWSLFCANALTLVASYRDYLANGRVGIPGANPVAAFCGRRGIATEISQHAPAVFIRNSGSSASGPRATAPRASTVGLRHLGRRVERCRAGHCRVEHVRRAARPGGSVFLGRRRL